MIARLWLVKNNVPFDVAFSISEIEVMAWGVILGRFEGGKFNEDSMSWETR